MIAKLINNTTIYFGLNQMVEFIGFSKQQNR